MNAVQTVKVLAYNTFDGFGQPKRADHLVDYVVSVAPDVAFFSEAYESSADVATVLKRFRTAGYTVLAAPYNDADGRGDKHNFLALSRLKSVIVSRRYATRNGLYGVLSVGGRSLRVIGLHADDRSEDGRLVQVRDVPPVDGPAFMMGDLNAMHGTEPISRVMRALRPVTRVLPSIEPDVLTIKQPLIPRLGNLAQRFSGMAQGETLRELERRGLYDADPLHTPTIHRIAQLDHVLVTSDVTVHSVRVHSDVSLSDHKPLSAVISI